MQTKKLLTVEEAANQLSLKQSTIRRRILEKTITTVRIGRAVRIPAVGRNQSLSVGTGRRVGYDRTTDFQVYLVAVE